MVSFPLQCTTNLFYDLLLTFLFLSFPFLSFPSFLHLPTFSFPKLLATSQIKSLGFQPEFCFWKFILLLLLSLFSGSSDFESLSSPFFFCLSFHVFFLYVENSFFVFCFFMLWLQFLTNSHNCNSGVCESWLFFCLFVFLIFFLFEKVCLLFYKLSIKIENHFLIPVFCFEPKRSSSFGLVLSKEILLGKFLCASDPCSHTSTS